MYIPQLTQFFAIIEKDKRIGGTHICIYMTLFQHWNLKGFKNPISITRSEIMVASNIQARATYHKCMKELHEYGYIKYIPSFHPLLGSLVYIIDVRMIALPKKQT